MFAVPRNFHPSGQAMPLARPVLPLDHSPMMQINATDSCTFPRESFHTLGCDRPNWFTSGFCAKIMQDHPQCFTMPIVPPAPLPSGGNPCYGVPCGTKEHCEDGRCVDNCIRTECTPNYLCNPSQNPGICEPDPNHKASFGESCSIFQCLPDLVCQPSSQTCRYPSQHVCTSDGQCASGICDSGLCL